jgi:hypothetical protein
MLSCAFGRDRRGQSVKVRPAIRSALGCPSHFSAQDLRVSYCHLAEIFLGLLPGPERPTVTSKSGRQFDFLSILSIKLGNWFYLGRQGGKGRQGGNQRIARIHA